MSLYIISQNKTIIKKVNDYIMIEEQITTNANNPNKNSVDSIITGYTIVVDNISLAKYTSRATAEKIVNEIQHLFANKTTSKGKDGMSDSAGLKFVNGDIFYEMPKDTPPTQKEKDV